MLAPERLPDDVAPDPAEAIRQARALGRRSSRTTGDS